MILELGRRRALCIGPGVGAGRSDRDKWFPPLPYLLSPAFVEGVSLLLFFRPIEPPRGVSVASSKLKNAGGGGGGGGSGCVFDCGVGAQGCVRVSALAVEASRGWLGPTPSSEGEVTARAFGL